MRITICCRTKSLAPKSRSLVAASRTPSLRASGEASSSRCLTTRVSRTRLSSAPATSPLTREAFNLAFSRSRAYRSHPLSSRSARAPSGRFRSQSSRFHSKRVASFASSSPLTWRTTKSRSKDRKCSHLLPPARSPQSRPKPPLARPSSSSRRAFERTLWDQALKVASRSARFEHLLRGVTLARLTSKSTRTLLTRVSLWLSRSQA